MNGFGFAFPVDDHDPMGDDNLFEPILYSVAPFAYLLPVQNDHSGPRLQRGGMVVNLDGYRRGGFPPGWPRNPCGRRRRTPEP